MKKILFVAAAILLLLCSLDAFASGEYIKGGARSPTAFLANIDRNAPAFTGGTVSIEDIRTASEWRIAPVGAGYETARVMGGRAEYWRRAAPSEMAVWVLKNGEWIPAFLVKCGNPVRNIAACCDCGYQNQHSWM